jgi:hypothetical protein
LRKCKIHRRHGDGTTGGLKMKQATFKLDYSGQRKLCDACGNWTEKFELGASGDLGDGETIFVCEDCIKHPATLDQRLADHIERFREYRQQRVKFLESLRGRLDSLPSPADWEKEDAAIRDWEEEQDRRHAAAMSKKFRTSNMDDA